MLNYINKFYSKSLHRELLDEKIKVHASLVEGNVLDVGSRNRRYDSFFKNAKQINAIDINPEINKNIIVADVTALPFLGEYFNTVICFEVLEYVMCTSLALDEIARVLKKGGLFIFSVPFLDPIHGDIDNIRYTQKGWSQLLDKRFIIKEIIILGGRYSTMWDFFFEKTRNHYSKICRLILCFPLIITKKIVLFLDEKEKNHRFPMGYFFICRKK